MWWLCCVVRQDEPMQPDETPLANAPSESTEEGQVQEVSEVLLPSVESSAVSFSAGGNNLVKSSHIKRS